MTPEQLAQLQAFWGNAANTGPGSLSLGDNTYSTMGVQHADEGGSSYTPNSLGRFIPGDTSQFYNVDPNTGNEQLMPWNHGGNFWTGTLKDVGPALAMVLGGQLAFGGGFGGTTGALTGADAAMADLAASGGLTAGDFAGAGAAAGGAAGAGAAGGYVTLPDIASVPALSDSVAGLSPLAVGGGSALSSLLPAGASSLLGPAAAVLGAAAGAKGQSKTTNEQKDIPEWLKPFVTGQGGLLDSTNSLMRDQMQYVPQQARQISNMGLGLLQQPVAGNGFAMFAGRRI